MPAVVKLPDNSILSVADLPVFSWDLRWVIRHKRAVANAVIYGLITYEEALRRYRMNPEELNDWIRAVEEHNVRRLLVKGISSARPRRARDWPEWFARQTQSPAPASSEPPVREAAE